MMPARVSEKMCRYASALAAVLALSACTAARKPVPAPPGREPDAGLLYAQGLRLLVSDGGSIDEPSRAYPWLLAAAERGNPRAQAAVGICLQRGWGVERDERKAVSWYRKAAQQGQSGAAIELALLAGKHGSEDEAMHWLKTALASGWGLPEAHLMLASLYLHKHMYREAVQHLRYAAMDGSGEAAYLMSLCYAGGCGVPKNEELARGWLSIATEAGYDPSAQQAQKKNRPQ